MLEFWLLKSEQTVVFKDGALSDQPDWESEYSIDITAFHRALDLGLGEVASDVGLSFFNDALIEVEASKKILAVLLDIDAKLNPAGNQTDTRAMAELFSKAVCNKQRVVAVCD